MAAGANGVHDDLGSRRSVKLTTGTVLLVAGAAIVVALAYAGASAPKARPSVFSTYDTGPNGYRALYEVLGQAGLPVRRFERALGALDPSVRTLVVTGYENDPAAKPMDEKDAAALRRFVERGGRLVAIDAEFAGSADVAPAVGTTVRNAGGDAIAVAANRYTAGVARVSGHIEWTFPLRKPRGVALLANRHGFAAVLYRLGRGEVVAITAPAIFGNRALLDADNLRFAYNAMAGRGDVAFDEYVHGYEDSPTLWSVLPLAVRAAAGIVCVAVLLALVGANVPFAPAYLPGAPDERDTTGYITAMADLMRRSRARPDDDVVVSEAVFRYRSRKEHA